MWNKREAIKYVKSIIFNLMAFVYIETDKITCQLTSGI